MKKLKAIIVDDERSARELLNDLVSDISWIEISGLAAGVDEAMQLIGRHGPDVLLLDIQMPGKDGFVLVEEIMKTGSRPEVIFITAYDKYAINAIRASAFDYLLKPVRKDELTESLERLFEKVKSGNLEQRFSELLYQLSDKKKIKFRNRTGFAMINPDEILFCRADSNYSILELSSGKRLTVTLNLGKVEEMLPSLCFCRVSRSVIINLHYLAGVDRKSMTCELVNEITHVLPVTKKYLIQLEEGCDRHFKVHR